MGEFGAYVRNLRDRAGLTLRELQERAGISNAYLSQVEQGKRNPPSPAILRRLAPVLGASLNDLMEKAGYLEPPSAAPEIEPQKIEALFDLISKDPICSLGQRAKRLTDEDKLSIIRLYERAKGVKLL